MQFHTVFKTMYSAQNIFWIMKFKVFDISRWICNFYKNYTIGYDDATNFCKIYG